MSINGHVATAEVNDHRMATAATALQRRGGGNYLRTTANEESGRPSTGVRTPQTRPRHMTSRTSHANDPRRERLTVVHRVTRPLLRGPSTFLFLRGGGFHTAEIRCPGYDTFETCHISSPWTLLSVNSLSDSCAREIVCGLQSFPASPSTAPVHFT